MEIELPKNPSLKGILFNSQIRLKKFLIIFLQILIIFFFFFSTYENFTRERDKENFCFRKQKLKASLKSKIEIKLYYLKIPYLESRILKIPSREKGRGETEIEGERVGRKYSVTYLHDRLRKQFRSGEEPVRVSTYVSRNVSSSKGSKRDENIHSLSVSLRAKERDEIKSYTVIAVFFSVVRELTHPASWHRQYLVQPLPSPCLSLPAPSPSTSAFSSLSKGFRGTRPVQYDVSKNVLQSYLAVLLVEEENNASRLRNNTL